MPLLVITFLTTPIILLTTPIILFLVLEVGEVEVDGCELFLYSQPLEKVLHVLFVLSPEVEERSSAEERSTVNIGS